MAKCGDCLHYNVCERWVEDDETFDEVGGCMVFISKDAFVKVVRCKDCQFWTDGVAGCTDHVKLCKIGFYMVGENGYCVFGERKGNG